MIGLDTNVLIRYLTRDDLDQWERASQIIQENQPCFISNRHLRKLKYLCDTGFSTIAPDLRIQTVLTQKSGFQVVEVKLGALNSHFRELVQVSLWLEI